MLVFISYSRRNDAMVSTIRQHLQAAGIAMWIDHEAIQPGTADWEEAIRTAIRQVEAIIYVASPSASSSRYVRDELDIAELYHKPIYPIWIEGENWIEAIPLGRGRIQYVDARGKRLTVGIQELVTALAPLRLADAPLPAAPPATPPQRPAQPVQEIRTLPPSPPASPPREVPAQRKRRTPIAKSSIAGIASACILLVVASLGFVFLRGNMQTGHTNTPPSATPVAMLKETMTAFAMQPDSESIPGPCGTHPTYWAFLSSLGNQATIVCSANYALITLGQTYQVEKVLLVYLGPGVLQFPQKFSVTIDLQSNNLPFYIEFAQPSQIAGYGSGDVFSVELAGWAIYRQSANLSRTALKVGGTAVGTPVQLTVSRDGSTLSFSENKNLLGTAVDSVYTAPTVAIVFGFASSTTQPVAYHLSHFVYSPLS